MKAAIYTRVSSEEQLDGHSLSAQEQAITMFCELRKYEIVKRYEERGRSGKNALRPEFQSMIADAEAGLFDVIVVHKLDRFSRSLLDTLTYLGKLEKLGVSFVSAGEAFDFTNPIGKVVLAILGAFAEWYLNNLANEVSKGKRERARKGFWNGRLAFGYTTPKRLAARLTLLGEQMKAGQIAEADYSRECKIIEDALEAAGDKHETAAIPDPVAADGVRLAYTLYSTGKYSDLQIAQALNAAGYRSNGKGGQQELFNRDTVRDLLRNRFYTGVTSYGAGLRGHNRRKGDVEWLPGNHEALISQELFDAAQSARQGRADRHGIAFHWMEEKRVYPLQGLLWCPHCGASWKGQFANGRRTYRHKNVPGMCNHEPRWTEGEALELVIGELLTELHLPDGWQQQIVEMLSSQGQRQDEDTAQFSKLAKRLDRLKKLFLEGDLELLEYRRQRDQITARLVALKVETPVDPRINIEQIGLLLSNLPIVWQSAQPDEKKSIINALVKKIWIVGGEIKAIEPTPVLWVLLSFTLAGRTGVIPLSGNGLVLVQPNTAAAVVLDLAA